MVSGSSAFQANCVSGEFPQTSQFYLSNEMFLRFLSAEEMFVRRWLIKVLWALDLRSGFFWNCASLEVQETWILPLSNCSKFQQLPDGWLMTKLYGRNRFLCRSSFLSKSFTGKKSWNCKRSTKYLDFLANFFSNLPRSKELLGIIFFRRLIKFSQFSWFLDWKGQWRSQHKRLFRWKSF